MEPGALRFDVKWLEEISALTISQDLTERVADEALNPNTANKNRELLQRLFNFATSNFGYVSPDNPHRSGRRQLRVIRRRHKQYDLLQRSRREAEAKWAGKHGECVK